MNRKQTDCINFVIITVLIKPERNNNLYDYTHEFNSGSLKTRREVLKNKFMYEILSIYRINCFQMSCT